MPLAEARKSADANADGAAKPTLATRTISKRIRQAWERSFGKSRIRSADARLREAIDILPEGIVFLDPDGRYILWNQQYAEIYNRSADLFHPGAKLEDTLRIGIARGDYPDSKGREDEWLAERLALMANPSGRHEQILSDGRTILIEERRTGDGGMIGLRVDITEMKKREASFRLLFEANPVPMFVYAIDDFSILSMNHAAAEHYGFTSGAPRSLADIVVRDPTPLAATSRLTKGEIEGFTAKHRRADGSLIDVALYSSDLTYENRPAVLLASIDVTERKRAEARAAFLAHHDALTSLPNRLLLRTRMEEALADVRGGGRQVATLCLDLDGFKAINDTLGHASGDRLLQMVAERISGDIGPGDTVARLGGDEFAILQTNVDSASQIIELSERILASVEAPYEIDEQLVTVGVSIGVALAPHDGMDAEILLHNADMALYRAKSDGRGRYCFFEPEMNARAQARRRIEVNLRKALRENELTVCYQPLVDLDSGHIVSLEALLRWRHPELGMISPAEFIPIAEETGMIISIGSFVLRRACQDAAAWPSNATVAINLSPLQFKTGSLFQSVRDALSMSGLPPTRLELEITETLLLDKSEQVLSTLHALRALGVRIAMDDFGTGYSSLSYLRSFPFDKIKIDRSFIQEISQKSDSQAIVRAILSLGSSLGVTITAEGVETESDLAYLKSEGCPQGQGFLFSAARSQAEVVGMLRAARAA
jgi:diguanylate cyclase (GGDEF)-like protein/PAS domain S-box-containing protein